MYFPSSNPRDNHHPHKRRSKGLQIQVPSGSKVMEALNMARIQLSEMDRVEPELETILTDGSQVKVIRVRQEFSVEQAVIPFEQQSIPNEAIPEGEQRLSQAGLNGLEEITYRRIFEDGIEISKSIVKTAIINEAIPEVIMVGTKLSFAHIPSQGK